MGLAANQLVTGLPLACLLLLSDPATELLDRLLCTLGFAFISVSISMSLGPSSLTENKLEPEELDDLCLNAPSIANSGTPVDLNVLNQIVL
jgi:hypothetical protein